MWRIVGEFLLKLILGSVSSFAKEVVKELEGVDMENAAKRDQAFESVGEAAKNEGKNLRSSAIALGIELALNLIRGKLEG